MVASLSDYADLLYFEPKIPEGYFRAGYEKQAVALPIPSYTRREIGITACSSAPQCRPKRPPRRQELSAFSATTPWQ